MVMTDTGASYGSLARFTNIERMKKVNVKTLVAVGGELSDSQFLDDVYGELATEDHMANDGHVRAPEELHSIACRILHNYRSRGNPLWNQVVTCGVSRAGKPFLGYVDLYGTNHVDDIVVTGFGMHMALPLLRKTWKKDMSEAEARTALEDAMRVLVYRHCRTINKFQIGTAKLDGSIDISEPFALQTKWDYNRFRDPRAQELPLPQL
jgi:20S proteasome subunit beta 7